MENGKMEKKYLTKSFLFYFVAIYVYMINKIIGVWGLGLRLKKINK